MAARNSGRGARRRGRSGGNRPRTHPPRLATETLAAMGPSAAEMLTREIRLLALRLKVIYRTAVTVEMALRYQNADQDADFADCLRHAVCEAGSNHERWEGKRQIDRVIQVDADS